MAFLHRLWPHYGLEDVVAIGASSRCGSLSRSDPLFWIDSEPLSDRAVKRMFLEK